MKRSILVCLLGGILLTLGACGKTPIEAPEDLGELTRYLFSNFESETGEELQAGLVELEEYMLTVDLEGELDDRAVTPPNLTEADLENTVWPSVSDLDAQVPVAVTRLSVNDLQGHYDLLSEPNQVCIASDGTVYHARTFDENLDCFVDGSCEATTSTNEIRFENFLAKVWLDEMSDFRNVELDDGRTAIVQKSWMEEQYESDNGSTTWDLRFSVSIRLPHPDDDGTTLRFNSFWSAASIPGVTDDIYAPLAKEGVNEGFENEDTFLAGGECDNDRDREYDRPTE